MMTSSVPPTQFPNIVQTARRALGKPQRGPPVSVGQMLASRQYRKAHAGFGPGCHLSHQHRRTACALPGFQPGVPPDSTYGQLLPLGIAVKCARKAGAHKEGKNRASTQRQPYPARQAPIWDFRHRSGEVCSITAGTESHKGGRASVPPALSFMQPLSVWFCMAPSEQGTARVARCQKRNSSSVYKTP